MASYGGVTAAAFKKYNDIVKRAADFSLDDIRKQLLNYRKLEAD